MTITYGILLAVSIAFLIGYCALIRKKEFWLLLLYICISVVILGYFLLSMSNTLRFALFANKLAYLGSCFLMPCMFMTIAKLCGFKPKKWLIAILIVCGFAMFGLICTTGYLPWYYKEVTLTYVNGAAKLEKVYGGWHLSYIVYIFLYFSAMVLTIIQSKIKKTGVGPRKHAILIASVVFGNIAVWFVEQFIPYNFEFLSVSYLMSELIFICLYWMLQDFELLQKYPQLNESEETLPAAEESPLSTEEKLEYLLRIHPPKEPLTAREKDVLTALLQNSKRKDIAENLHISENTVKTHTAHIFDKFGVFSRNELFLLLENENA